MNKAPCSDEEAVASRTISPKERDQDGEAKKNSTKRREKQSTRHRGYTRDLPKELTQLRPDYERDKQKLVAEWEEKMATLKRNYVAARCAILVLAPDTDEKKSHPVINIASASSDSDSSSEDDDTEEMNRLLGGVVIPPSRQFRTSTHAAMTGSTTDKKKRNKKRKKKQKDVREEPAEITAAASSAKRSREDEHRTNCESSPPKLKKRRTESDTLTPQEPKKKKKRKKRKGKKGKSVPAQDS